MIESTHAEGKERLRIATVFHGCRNSRIEHGLSIPSVALSLRRGVT